jgi:4-carboxymuconolactone decarboxylase
MTHPAQPSEFASASDDGVKVAPLPWSPMGTPIPLVDLQGELGKRVAGLGARQVNLYRSLAHAPRLLEAWIDFAWALRRKCSTSRSMRELMILRTAVVMRSEYEWHQHRRMAEDTGVSPEQVLALAAWQVSDLFDDQERAALMLTDAMLTGIVPDAVHAALARHFDEQQRVELVLTAGFYAMVPRVLDALRVPVEDVPE